MTRLHGVKTIEIDSGTLSVSTVSTAVIGLVGTAPDATGGVAASGRTGSALTENALVLSAKAAGAEGNAITVLAVAGVPGEGAFAPAVSAGSPQAEVPDSPGSGRKGITKPLQAAEPTPLAATPTPDSAVWSAETGTLLVTLGCDAAGATTATAGSIAGVINAVSGCPVVAQGEGRGILRAFSLTLSGGIDAPFPLNTPVVVTGAQQSGLLGRRGTLTPALEEITDQGSALVIVVRVEEKAVDTEQRATVISGIDALDSARALTTVQPRILIAPGFSEDDAVAKSLEAMAETLRAVAYIDSPAMSPPQAVVERRSLFGGRVELLRHRVARTDSHGIVRYRPASAVSAGLRARIDHEKGWWWSKSNQPVLNITGTEQTDSFSLNDENCTANLLNASEVSTMIRYDGFRHWGNRLCSSHPQWSFESVRRSADVIEDSIEETMMLFMDRPLDNWVVDDITGTVNSYLRSLTTLGAIHGGRCWPDEELNTAESLAAGELWLNYDFGPKSPLEKLTMRVRINNTYNTALQEAVRV